MKFAGNIAGNIPERMPKIMTGSETAKTTKKTAVRVKAPDARIPERVGNSFPRQTTHTQMVVQDGNTPASKSGTPKRVPSEKTEVIKVSQSKPSTTAQMGVKGENTTTPKSRILRRIPSDTESQKNGIKNTTAAGISNNKIIRSATFILTAPSAPLNIVPKIEESNSVPTQSLTHTTSKTGIKANIQKNAAPKTSKPIQHKTEINEPSKNTSSVPEQHADLMAIFKGKNSPHSIKRELQVAERRNVKCTMNNGNKKIFEDFLKRIIQPTYISYVKDLINNPDNIKKSSFKEIPLSEMLFKSAKNN
ncbi:hypothetical protein CCS41_13080 [Candidatus Fukatsuia symbiotica]|uniref:Uncharacterized protein n=2 Tax=Yersiniaceae TaxID=1903411 RepID=A0A2U8IAH3_9GAMM|nr:hypothetical protein CCS41_13080 [Candidatus Fukatsuia symbiotica]